MPTIPPKPAPAPVPEVRFVFAAPSPHTGRFDATRAGLGIALELHRMGREQQLPVRISLMALPRQASEAEVKALLELSNQHDSPSLGGLKNSRPIGRKVIGAPCILAPTSS